uniref:Membrane protein V1 n=1 Tax=Anisakis simplex TaxID=6269 RepID=A0A0M3KGB1_ANISI
LLSFASSPSSSHSSSSPTPSPSSSSSRIAASSTSPPTNVYSKKRKKSSSFAVSDCSCIHPCDLIEGADASPFASTSQIIRYVGDYAPQNRPEGIYDFFSSPNHCSSRRRYCDALRERQYAWKESVRRAQFRTSSTTEQSQSSREHLDSVSSTVLSPAVTPHHHPTTSAPSNRRSNNYVGSIHHPGSSNFLELPDENDGIAKSLSAYADDRYDMIQLSNGDADERNRRRQNEVYRLDSTGGDENDLGDEAMDDGYEKRAGNEPEEVDNYISEWRTTARSRRRVVMRNAESRVQWRRASSSSSASRLIASTDRYRVVSRLFLRMVTEVLFFSLFAFVVFW